MTKNNLGILFAFLILAGGMSLAIASSARHDATLLRHSQIRACQSDNKFRTENNNRGNVIRALIAANRDVLNLRSDQVRSKDLKNIGPVSIKDIPLRNCQKAYPKP